MRSTAKRNNLNLSLQVYYYLFYTILGLNNSPASAFCEGLGAFTVKPGSEINLSSKSSLALLMSDTAWDPWNTMKGISRQQAVEHLTV